MREETLFFAPELFIEWRNGSLAEKWTADCPELFTQRDFDIVKNQTKFGFHFGEWYTARHFGSKGFRVLIEKYVFPSHPKALSTSRELLGTDGVEFLRRDRSCAPPDLLVYSPDRSIFFFVEVKKAKDRIQPKQSLFFSAIESRFRCEVIVVHALPDKQHVAWIENATFLDHLGHGVRFLHDDMPGKTIAFLEGFGWREVSGTATVRLAAVGATYDIGDDVRKAVAAFLAARQMPDWQFRCGKVHVVVNG